MTSGPSQAGEEEALLLLFLHESPRWSPERRRKRSRSVRTYRGRARGRVHMWFGRRPPFERLDVPSALVVFCLTIARRDDDPPSPTLAMAFFDVVSKRYAGARDWSVGARVLFYNLDALAARWRSQRRHVPSSEVESKWYPSAVQCKETMARLWPR